MGRRSSTIVYPDRERICPHTNSRITIFVSSGDLFICERSVETIAAFRFLDPSRFAIANCIRLWVKVYSRCMSK